MLYDPLRRSSYFFRTDVEIYFPLSEYSYFRKKEDLNSFFAWFDQRFDPSPITHLDGRIQM